MKALLALLLVAAPAAAQDGAALYARHCLRCHQSDGGGVPRFQPPLTGSEIVRGPAAVLTRYVILGAGGEGPSEWQNEMPGFAALDDRDLAAVLSFVRARFGPAGPVTPSEVSEARP